MLNNVIAFLNSLVELLKPILPALAAFLAGKSSQKATDAEKKSAALKRAKDVAVAVDALDDNAVNDRLSKRWKR